MDPIETISAEDLKAKLARGDDFKLIMTLSEWAFRAKHIPGSMQVDSPAQAIALLKLDDEIIVYCSDVMCPASQFAYRELKAQGFQNVRRYSGGLSEWEEKGYPLEGEMVE